MEFYTDQDKMCYNLTKPNDHVQYAINMERTGNSYIVICDLCNE